jgi:hypothetical protein
MFGHADADAIDEILADGFQIITGGQMVSAPSLGEGEVSVLNILPQLEDAVIVSDDRRFLTMLVANGIRHLTPADVLVALTRERTLTESDALEALERMRSAIHPKVYQDARMKLEPRGETHEQD